MAIFRFGCGLARASSMPIGASGSIASMPGTTCGCIRLSAISSTTRSSSFRLRAATCAAALPAAGVASAPTAVPILQLANLRTRLSRQDRNTSRLSDSSAVPRAGAATRT
ncbi:hypothetical protein D9M71_602590 [compost metagenome]